MSPIDENGVIVLTRDGVGGGPLGHASTTQKVGERPNPTSTHSMASLPQIYANSGTFLIQKSKKLLYISFNIRFLGKVFFYEAILTLAKQTTYIFTY